MNAMKEQRKTKRFFRKLSDRILRLAASGKDTPASLGRRAGRISAKIIRLQTKAVQLELKVVNFVYCPQMNQPTVVLWLGKLLGSNELWYYAAKERGYEDESLREHQLHAMPERSQFASLADAWGHLTLLSFITMHCTVW